jgi:hypothetical protein
MFPILKLQRYNDGKEVITTINNEIGSRLKFLFYMVSTRFHGSSYTEGPVIPATNRNSSYFNTETAKERIQKFRAIKQDYRQAAQSGACFNWHVSP